MKFLRFSVYLAVALLSALSFGGCSKVQEPDYREHDYGYVQFKLYKEASYPGTKAIGNDPLEYLSDATKIKVTLGYGDDLIYQTLTFSYADAVSAEFGIRTEKLKLLAGEYKLLSFVLYDKKDQEVYEERHPAGNFSVVSGGLVVHDVVADTRERGSVRFNLVKDMSNFKDAPQRNKAVTKAGELSRPSAYVFDDIAFVDLVVYNNTAKEQLTFSKLPAKYSVHFDETDDVEDGYQVSSIKCDTLLTLRGGEYIVKQYTTYNSDKKSLEINYSPKQCQFTIADNQTTEVNVPVTLYETDEYIKDYYALKAIWDALHGEDWYYIGESFNTGTNWNFNKDVDLWGDQPGVQLHANGRVALIDLSNFGFYGHMPEEIGQLTELIELYLGTHNDTNMYTYESKDYSANVNRKSRMDAAKEYLRKTHPATQFSEPIARAMMEKGVDIPEIAMYKKYTEAEIIDKATGLMKVRPMDTNPGVIVNGLKSLPESIGNLKSLTKICIANSELAALPESFKELTSCTDVEIYNLPNMVEFPTILAEMPALIQANLSCNPQWSATCDKFKRHDDTNGTQSDYGMDCLATGPASKTLQMIYMNDCGMSELTKNVSNLKSLGLLSLSYNKIDKIYAFGSDIVMVQLYLDHNQISEIEMVDGVFCGMDDVENLSFSYNKLTKLPDIFTAKSLYTMASVDFSGNLITGVEAKGPDGKYKGINVETLTLSNNPITTYPVEFAESGSKINFVNLRGCRLNNIPKEAFEGKNSHYLVSLDLSYNDLDDLPSSFTAVNMPYFYGLELSYNKFSKFPYEPLDCSGLTVFGIRAQRNDAGERCLSEWPEGIYQHTGLRGFYIGSNNLGKIDDTISPLCYYLEVSDNPNIILDASTVCYEYSIGAYYLIYDKSQDIRGCEIMK